MVRTGSSVVASTVCEVGFPQKRTLTRGCECQSFIWESSGEALPRERGAEPGMDGKLDHRRHIHEQKPAVNNWSLLGTAGRQYRASLRLFHPRGKEAGVRIHPLLSLTD